MDKRNQTDSQGEDLRGRIRESDHLKQKPRVEILVDGNTIPANLIDESISGVAAALLAPHEFEPDQCVEVARGDYRRDAIVRRLWKDESGRLHVGLQWRASYFVR